MVKVEDQYIPERVFEQFSYKHLDKDNLNMHYVEEHLRYRMRTKYFQRFTKDYFILNHRLYLHSIKEFSINQTKIESIDLDVFQNMPNVESVDFSDNKIKKIAHGFLHNMRVFMNTISAKIK